MADTDQGSRCNNVNTELFMDFAIQRLADRFIRLQLATRKFPQATLMDMVRPQTQQYTILPIHNGRYRHMQYSVFRCGIRH